MARQFLDSLEKYFQSKTAPTKQEQELMTQLKQEAETFWIAFIDRKTLIRHGYNVSNLSDDDMTEIAGIVGDYYCGSSKFENDITVACEKYGVEKLLMCPRCEFQNFIYNPEKQVHQCLHCGREWGDNYVLAEYPHDTIYFENNEIGYPSFEREDNGARYVPEYEYLLYYREDPPSNTYFKPLRWPESQPYLCPDKPDMSVDALCEPINDEFGIEDFGEQAVWVPLCLLKNQ